MESIASRLANLRDTEQFIIDMESPLQNRFDAIRARGGISPEYVTAFTGEPATPPHSLRGLGLVTPTLGHSIVLKRLGNPFAVSGPWTVWHIASALAVLSMPATEAAALANEHAVWCADHESHLMSGVVIWPMTKLRERAWEIAGLCACHSAAAPAATLQNYWLLQIILKGGLRDHAPSLWTVMHHSPVETEDILSVGEDTFADFAETCAFDVPVAAFQSLTHLADNALPQIAADLAGWLAGQRASLPVGATPPSHPAEGSDADVAATEPFLA